MWKATEYVDMSGVCWYLSLTKPSLESQSFKVHSKPTPRAGYLLERLAFLQCHVGQRNLVGLPDNADGKPSLELRLVEAGEDLPGVIWAEVGGSPAQGLAAALVSVTVGEESLDGVSWHAYVAFEENVDLDMGLRLKVLLQEDF